MPTRIIRDGINSSRRVNSLSTEAELFYRRLISVVDDYGRYYASPVTLLAACWPTCPEKIREHDLRRWLGECLRSEIGFDPLISLYEHAGTQYLQINNFGQRTRSKSKFPDPVNVLPAICGQVTDKCPQSADNPRTIDGQLTALVGDEVVVGDGGDALSRVPKQTSRGELPEPVFMEACRAAGIDGSEADWIEAGFEWRRLDFEQKLAAVEGIRIRMRDAPDDPALTALPQNYLKKRMWQRPIRGSFGMQPEPVIKRVRM